MKTKIILFFSLFLFWSCGVQTLKTYNETIVSVHQEFFDINNKFYEKYYKLIGKPNAKQEFSNLIEVTKLQIIDAQKPLDELIKIKDHGLKETLIDMYNKFDDSLDLYKGKLDLFTDSTKQDVASVLILKELNDINELDELLKELQIQFAYYNKAKLTQ